MRTAETRPAQYYFALPRLVASLRSQHAPRSENNWIEANIVGMGVMLVSYLAIARPLLRGAALATQLTLLLPLVLAMWPFWLLVLYLNALLIKLLRITGFLTDVSNARAQSILTALITTALAWQLLAGPPAMRAVGATWLVSVCLNFIAAAILAFRNGT